GPRPDDGFHRPAVSRRDRPLPRRCARPGAGWPRRGARRPRSLRAPAARSAPAPPRSGLRVRLTFPDLRSAFQAASRYALTVLANRRGAVPKPSYVTYLVTYRCNAKCGMCDSWRMRPGPELTLEEVRRVFEKLSPLDAVRLSGGEPFLRTDFAELAG